MTLSSFRELRVWQMAMDLVEEIYRLTRTFPRHELYGLSGQMRRASVSVPSNIAEGYARQHRKEFNTCQRLRRLWRNWRPNWKLPDGLPTFRQRTTPGHGS